MQIDALAALEKALRLYSVVAWRLLWLTYLAREDPQAPADEVLRGVEKEVLARATGQPVSNAREALLAVAKVGGFVASPSAGFPGVKSLWLGFRKLRDLTTGFLLAQRPPPSLKGQD